jgi:hypothetical protein
LAHGPEKSPPRTPRAPSAASRKLPRSGLPKRLAYQRLPCNVPVERILFTDEQEVRK